MVLNTNTYFVLNCNVLAFLPFIQCPLVARHDGPLMCYCWPGFMSTVFISDVYYICGNVFFINNKHLYSLDDLY